MPSPSLAFAASIWIAPALALLASGAAIESTVALIEDAYASAPAVMLALTALLILPAVAVISAASRTVQRYRDRRAAEWRARALDVAGGETGNGAGGEGGDLPDAGGLPRRSEAWITVEGAGGGETVALTSQMVRIGRHHANDICLADWSVHRRHAVIERAPDEAFLITDVSGTGGSGLRINGQRTQRAPLADGDVIEIGRARLRFERPETPALTPAGAIDTLSPAGGMAGSHRLPAGTGG